MLIQFSKQFSHKDFFEKENAQNLPECLQPVHHPGLSDASHFFEHGTMEERKLAIRASVENLTIDGVVGCVEL